jgi:outer membrane biosynthesis protein TonB
LKNFVEVCDKSFANKTVAVPIVQPKPTVSAPVPQPEVQPPVIIPAAPPATFGHIPQSDIDEWQKAIAGIEGKQSELLPNEFSAFEMLKMNCRNGNFTSAENVVNIQIIKDLQKRTKNRLLLVNLNKFSALCEKYFKIETIQTITLAPTFTPPVITPPKKVEEPKATKQPKEETIIKEETKATEDTIETTPKPNKPKGNMILIAIAVVVLIGGWLIFKNWDTIKSLFDKEEPTEQPTNQPAIINPLVSTGQWSGTLNTMEAAFEFLNIADGKVEAKIYFPGNQTDSLSGTVDGLILNLRNTKTDALYDGIYTGTLQSDSSMISGTMYRRDNGAAIAFEFFNPTKSRTVQADTTTETQSIKPEITPTPVPTPKPKPAPKPKPVPTPAPDYTKEAQKAFENAQNALKNGQYDAAYKYYNEAINYKTPQSEFYGKTGSINFTGKAKQFLNLGICDDNTKKWLDYAYRLHYTNEIQELLNKCH